MTYRSILGAGVLGFLLSATASHAVVVGSFTGTYDEATGIEAAGDFDNIGGSLDVGDFVLVDGVNTFIGSVSTPSDGADVFNIVLNPFFFLTSASISFGTNVNGFNPYFGFPSPDWGLFENDTTPTIFNVGIPDSGNNGSTSVFNSTPGFAERGPGSYNMVLGNGTYGTNNGAVDYTMTFTVEDRTPPPPPPEVPPIPLPAGIWLLLAGLGGLVMAQRRTL